MCVNTEKRSRNHFCRGKAISIARESVFARASVGACECVGMRACWRVPLR